MVHKSGRRIDPNGVIHDWATRGFHTVCGIQLPDPWVWTEEPTTCDKCIRGECTTTMDEQFSEMMRHPFYKRMGEEDRQASEEIERFLGFCTALGCTTVGVSSGRTPVDQGAEILPNEIRISREDFSKLLNAIGPATI